MYRGIREGKEGDLEFEINIFSISGQVSGVKSNQLIFWLWQYFKGFLELLILDFTPETSILPNLHIVHWLFICVFFHVVFLTLADQEEIPLQVEEGSQCSKKELNTTGRGDAGFAKITND